MEIIHLTESDNEIFEQICAWYYEWLGEKNGESYEEVVCTMEHSINRLKLPQTFVAMIDDKPAGMYQLAVTDDLNSRPDIYPWLINVYVDEKFRGHDVCRNLMASVPANAKKAGIDELHLYTKHIGLYEKFGWEYVEEVRTFKDDSPIERLYRLDLHKQ